ncbi:hypothetical protein BKA80DRAFT_40876 [Phyllosticta citrichinensis]
MEYVEDDSFHANPHFLDQDEPEPGPSEAVPPPPPPAPAPPTNDVVVPPPVAPIVITTGQLPPGITVPSSPSSGKSVHFPEGLEDPKGTSIRNGKKVLNRKASLSNLKEPPKPIIPLVQKREHKGLTWKEQQEKRRQDHEKRREAAKQQALKWMEAAKKKKELDLQQKKEAAEKARKKREEDAEKAQKKAEEDAIKAKKKKELEAEKAKKAEELKKKKAEEAKKKKELEAKKKEDAKKKADEARKKLTAKKSALKKPKAKASNSSGGDAAAADGVPLPAPDPPSASEEVTKSVLPSDAHEESAQVPPPYDISACHDADPADERIDAPAETSLEAVEETQAKLNPDDCTVAQGSENPPDSDADQHESLGQEPGQEPRRDEPGQDEPSQDGPGQEKPGPEEPFQDEPGGLENQVLEVERVEGAGISEAMVESVQADSTGAERQGEDAVEESAQQHVEVPDEGPNIDDASPAEQSDESGKDSEEPSVEMEVVENLPLNSSTVTPTVEEAGHDLQDANCETNEDQELDTGAVLHQEEAIDEAPRAKPTESQDEGGLYADCPDCVDILAGPASHDNVDISNDPPDHISDHETPQSDVSPQSGENIVGGAEEIDISEDHEIPVDVPSAHSPDHAGDDATETTNVQPSDSSVVPEQVLPDSDAPSPEHGEDACDQLAHSDASENLSSDEVAPDSNRAQDDTSPLFSPQDVDDNPSEETVQPAQLEQMKDGFVPPPAPDVPGIDDQSHLDEDDVSSLPPQDISEQHSADGLDETDESDRQDDECSLPPPVPDAPCAESQASPVQEGNSTQSDKNDGDPAPVQEDLEQPATNDATDTPDSEQIGHDDSGALDAPAAPADDTESQKVDQGSPEAKEQPPPDDSDRTADSNEIGHNETIPRLLPMPLRLTKANKWMRTKRRQKPRLSRRIKRKEHRKPTQMRQVQMNPARTRTWNMNQSTIPARLKADRVTKLTKLWRRPKTWKRAVLGVKTHRRSRSPLNQVTNRLKMALRQTAAPMTNMTRAKRKLPNLRLSKNPANLTTNTPKMKRAKNHPAAKTPATRLSTPTHRLVMTRSKAQVHLMPHKTNQLRAHLQRPAQLRTLRLQTLRKKSVKNPRTWKVHPTKRILRRHLPMPLRW